MNNLKSSFDDVADWMERYLESQRGLKVGMTFGALLRVYGRLAALADDQTGTAEERELTVKALCLLASLSGHLNKTNYRSDRRIELAQPISMRTNMIYDPGPQTRDGDRGV